MLISINIKMKLMPHYSVNITKYPIPSAAEDEKGLFWFWMFQAIVGKTIVLWSVVEILYINDTESWESRAIIVKIC